MRRQKDNKRRNQNQDNFLKPKRACQFTAAGVEEIDYNNRDVFRSTIYSNPTWRFLPKNNQRRILVKFLKKENQIITKGIEVGHIFYFSDKYSKPMNFLIDDKFGKKT